jgi:hypothetical protein
VKKSQIQLSETDGWLLSKLNLEFKEDVKLKEKPISRIRLWLNNDTDFNNRDRNFHYYIKSLVRVKIFKNLVFFNSMKNRPQFG